MPRIAVHCPVLVAMCLRSMTQSTLEQTSLRLKPSLIAMTVLDDYARAFPGMNPRTYLTHRGIGGGSHARITTEITGPAHRQDRRTVEQKRHEPANNLCRDIVEPERYPAPVHRYVIHRNRSAKLYASPNTTGFDRCDWRSLAVTCADFASNCPL